MSKKMSEHHRLFKLYKAGFFDKVPITDEQKTILKVYYPFLFPDMELNIVKL